MILIDTNVIVDHLNGKQTSIETLIGKEILATCGIIIVELFHGIQSNKDKLIISDALGDFTWITIEESLWPKVGMTLNTLKKKGLTVPFQDAVIATICIEKKLTLLTNDSHFIRIRDILPALVLQR
jgi:predicted nucleic acid-binding protein